MRQQTKPGIRWAALAACAVVALTFAGCGGDSGNPSAPDDSGGNTAPPAPGGGGDSTNPPAATRSAAEGVWQFTTGTGSGSYDRLIILGDGTYWGVYGELNSSAGWTWDPSAQIWVHANNVDVYQPGGVTHGTVGLTGNSLTGTGADINWNPSYSENYNFSGTVSAQNTLTQDGSLWDYSYDANASYDQQVTLASLAGQYSSTNTGSGYSSYPNPYVPGAFIITATGVLTLASDPVGCAASGTIAQHQTLHGPVGVFDIKLTFSGATCPLGDGTTGTGIAYLTGNDDFLEVIGFTSNKGAFTFRGLRTQ